MNLSKFSKLKYGKYLKNLIIFINYTMSETKIAETSRKLKENNNKNDRYVLILIILIKIENYKRECSS